MAYRVGRPHTHSSEIYCVKSCPADSGSDLLAVGGEVFLEVLRQDTASEEPSYVLVSSINLGSRVTAIAWSRRTRSPFYSSEEWFIELAVACDDERIRVITVVPGQEPTTAVIGDATSGHTGPINDLCFCAGGQGEGKYIASVGDDRRCIIWDLSPSSTESESRDRPNEPPSHATSPGYRTPSPLGSSSPPSALPIAYPIPFSSPLHSVCSHPHDARNILVSDSSGVLTVLNWMDNDDTAVDGEAADADRTARLWRGHRRAEFIDPVYLSRSASGVRKLWSGGASWKPNDPDVFGAIFGSNWHVWTQRSIQGGKPALSGESFGEGGDRFRWCPTNSRLFALSSSSPKEGAVVKVIDYNFPKNPRSIVLGPRPNRVRDFDWIGTPSQESQDSPAWLAVAVGRRVLLVDAGNLD